VTQGDIFVLSTVSGLLGICIWLYRKNRQLLSSQSALNLSSELLIRSGIGTLVWTKEFDRLQLDPLAQYHLQIVGGAELSMQKFLGSIPAGDAKKLKDSLDLLSVESVASLELSLGGRLFWFKFFRVSDTQITGLILDVSELVMGNTQLIKNLKMEAECAFLTKNQFLSNMSHEIRTPMNGVLGISELLLDTDLNSEQIEYVQIICHSAEKMLKVVNDLLDVTKLESHSLVLDVREFRLSILVKECMDQVLMSALNKGLQIKSYASDEGRDLFLGDTFRVKQILLNLLDNAIKFTDSGTVDYKIVKQDKERVRICFVVQDTGIGLSDCRLDLMFEPFYLADESNTRKYGGSGLGLPIVKRLSELMGGYVTAKTRPDGGAQFTVEIELLEQNQ